MKANWERALDLVSVGFQIADDKDLLKMCNEFKTKYPGKYNINFDDENNHIELVFVSLKEKTWCMLKWN